MPAKRSTRVSKTHTRKKTRRGGSVISWIKDKAIPWLKSNKLISRGASALAGVLPPQYAGIASAVSSGASKLGFGRRRSSRGGALSYGRTGGSLMSMLGKAKAMHDKVKSGRYISKGLMLGHQLTGNPKLMQYGTTAQKHGYGLGYGGAGRRKKKA